MHEMSLAEGILQIVEDHARSGAFRRVTAVVLEIGQLSGVEVEALRFAFDAVTRGSVAENAQMQVVSVPGTGWCLGCSRSVTVSQLYDPCPHCGGYQIQVTGGSDMRVKELAVEPL
jgi:hydrogenase nickel incorporation protein HypA/HybF